jgi:hypothetical protein
MARNRKDHPHLRLIGDPPGDLNPADPFADLEEARYRPSPEIDAAQPKLQRRPGRLFAQIELDWLVDQRMQPLMSREMRLYLLLQIRTIRGSRTVRLTNIMAAEAGVDRFQKSRCLHRLEELELVKVMRVRNRTPEVVWLPP